MISQIQRERELCAGYGRLDAHVSRRMADPEESGKAPAFRLECVHGECLMAAAARMHHMIPTTPYRSLHPGVDYIECQRRVNTDCRVQRGPWLPRPEANAGEQLSLPAPRPGAAQARHLLNRCRQALGNEIRSAAQTTRQSCRSRQASVPR